MKVEMAVDHAALENIINSFDATEKQIEAAGKSALHKTGSWLKTRIKKGAAQKLNITQKSIENRFWFKKMEPGSAELILTVGTEPVLPFSVGNPSIMGSSAKPTGIKVRSHRFPGAFISQIYSKNKNVWIRLHSTHYSPELYPSGSGESKGIGSFPGSEGRFPVVKVGIPIDDIVQEVVESLEDDLGKKYEEILTRELNYQVNVKGAGK
jgi:hypothetical protein